MPQKSPGSIVILAWGVVALIASFFLAGEEHYPGRFFIERQAFWNDGTYYVKFTFLAVLITLLDVVAVPVICFTGLQALLRRPPDLAPQPPPTWDVAQRGRRLKFGAFVLLGTPAWLAFTGAAVLAPQLLTPIGFIAGTLLIAIPIMPMALPTCAFEALASPRYVEGKLESVRIVENKNNRTAHLLIAGTEYQTHPDAVSGLPSGANVGLLVSGYLGKVLRLERRGSSPT
jgi:hypothetical protein